MKNLLAVLGVALLSTLSTAAAQAEPIEKPEVQAEKPAECPVIAPETAPDGAPAPQGVACGPVQNTLLYTAGGSTCAIARQSLEGVVTGAAGCDCGFCSKQFVYKECKVIQGGYQVSGYLKYSCQICPIS